MKPRYSKNKQQKIKLVFIESLGCSKNLVKSEAIASVLSENGYTFPKDQVIPTSSDLVIINTCGFIKSARDEAEQVIKKYENSWKEKIKVLIVGCYASRFSKVLKRKFPSCIVIESINPIEGLQKVLGFENKTSYQRTLSTAYYAYLEIATGCNKSCSYCLIPSIQGSFKSKTMSSLMSEVRLLVTKNNIKELVLIAQDTASYGLDLSPQTDLLSLVRSLSLIKEIEWIRIMYLYPILPINYISEVLTTDKVIPYLDLPLQHFSPKILSLMNRSNQTETYLNQLFEYKSKHPKLALRSTFMVGFPGETEDDFNLLLKGLRKYPFDKAGFFSYSREKSTLAYSMDHWVHPSTKKRRLKEVYSLQEKISLQENQKWIGKTMPVLLERFDSEQHYAYGRTHREAPEVDSDVIVTGNPFHIKKKIGTIQTLKITNASAYQVTGSLQE